MDWDEEKQARFDDLRLRQLSDGLTAAEQAELQNLMTVLEQNSVDSLAPVLARLAVETTALQARLQKQQDENEALAQLLHQQEQLVAEGRQWLATFEKRHTQIREAYTRLTGDVLTLA